MKFIDRLNNFNSAPTFAFSDLIDLKTLQTNDFLIKFKKMLKLLISYIF